MKIDKDFEQWKLDKPKYRGLGDYIKPFLQDLFFQHGINVSITVRVKEDFKLYKKLVEKRNKSEYSYQKLSDKLGVRIICRFQSEIFEINDIVDKNFTINKTENFYENYLQEATYDKQGYKGIHKDVELKEDNPEYEKFKGLIFEIQIRSMCDNVWADIYHDWGYKPEKILSIKTRRELHCLAGLLETADHCFSTINNSLESPESNVLTPDFIGYYIEKPFYRFFRSQYDIDFSRDNLKFLTPLLEIETNDAFKEKFSEFIKSHHDKISRIAKEGRGDFLTNLLLSQPEVLVIFYLLDKNKFSLKRKWHEHFSDTDLEDLSTRWGDPITVQ